MAGERGRQDVRDVQDVRGQQGLAERFEEHRGQLQAVAYRMLGSLTEAEDAVQEAWLRLDRSGEEGIDNLGAWLTTVTGRICLDLLRSRTARREEPMTEGFDSFVPDPVLRALPQADPEQEALHTDSVGIALLVVLETLEPAERLAFVLHDMFAVPFRRHRTGRRAQPGRHQAARQPGPAPRARGDPRRRTGPGPPAPGGRRVPGREPRR